MRRSAEGENSAERKKRACVTAPVVAPSLRHLARSIAYRLRSSPESAQCDPIRGLGSFKLLYRLSARPDLLADLVKSNAESFADGRDPSTRRASGRRPHILKGAVKLR